jgi:TRAP-type C4-dicarboxylate transport system permease small subunit
LQENSILKLLENLAKLCAILAGAVMALIILLTCASILGRELLGKTVPGDFELVGLATGAAIGLFMPLCQLQNGNIIVDFFTSGMPKRVNAGLDRMAAMTLALSFALLAWRAALGGLNAWDTHSGTMLLGVPEWIAYATMVPAFALTAVIGLYQCAFGFGKYLSHGHAEGAA